MIKLFRNIRKNLLNEGNTTKYFKYAIGEIVLVVIGILIALQINNWNTNKANEKNAYNQLLEVQKEVLNNIVEFDENDTYYFEKLRDLRQVMSDTLTLEDYYNHRTLRSIMSSGPPIVTQNEAFNKLVDNADNLPETYKPLVTELKKLYNHSRFETSYDDLMVLKSQYFDFISEFTESMYREEYEDYFQFLLTNPEYKDKLSRYSWTLDDLAPRLGVKKYQAIAVYKQMIALGFPDDGKDIINSMYVDVTPKTAKPFIGSYTNTLDTMHIRLQNKYLTIGFNKSIETRELSIRDSTALFAYGAYLEFNNDKTEFYFLMEANKPHFKRIPTND
jgi:hypothetical protein